MRAVLVAIRRFRIRYLVACHVEFCKLSDRTAQRRMRCIDPGIEVTDKYPFAGQAGRPQAIHLQALDAPGRARTKRRRLDNDRPDEAELRSLFDFSDLRIGFQRRKTAGIYIADRQTKMRVDANTARRHRLRPLELAAGEALRRNRKARCLRLVRDHEIILDRAFRLR